MVGTNTDGARLFLVASGAIDHVTDEALAGSCGRPTDSRSKRHRTLSCRTSGEPAPATCLRLSRAVLVVSYPRPPPGRCTRRRAPAATYSDQFAGAHRSSTDPGACHGLEYSLRLRTALGTETEPLWERNPPATARDTTDATWVAFATRGDPGWPSTSFGAGQPERASIQR